MNAPSPGPRPYPATAVPNAAVATSVAAAVATGGPEPDETARAGRRDELRVAALVAGWLWIAGLLLGWIWALWTPAGPLGEHVSGGLLTTEDEAWATADARFAVITAAVGLLAAVALWFVKPARGPFVMLGLAVGTVGGALLSDLLGHLIDHQTNSARYVKQGLVQHLALRVHATGMLFVEGVVAVLVYGVLVAFARDDDLGRPDPSHRPWSERSVGAQHGLQHGGGDRDGAGLAQQHDLPPQ